jgi:hypothetical protein
MSFEVRTISVFERQAKRLVKKFPSLKSELTELTNQLKEKPTSGTAIGNNCYKIRLAIASKGTGKSAGARVITHVVFKNNTVFLISIFDKSDIENITDKEILQILKQIQ